MVAERPGIEPSSAKATDRRSLLVSILIFGGTEHISNMLDYLPGLIFQFQRQTGLACRLVVRNNNPTLNTIAVQGQIDSVAERFPTIPIGLVGSGYNLGFGRGHNENFRAFPSDYLLILNDDVAFPHLDWLNAAIGKFITDPKLALLGAIENPRLLNPFFANGVWAQGNRLYPLSYAEASVMLARGAAFEAIGMFDEGLEWAMLDDSDLSLKAQQMGWRVDWMSMPHQHWRSTSFNALPFYAKSAIQEHNRAYFFAKWGQALANGKVGSFEVLDVYSDGIGDAFCALLHIRAEYERLPVSQHPSLIVNTRHPAIAEAILPTSAKVMSEPDMATLMELLEPQGVSGIRSIRSVNFSTPLNIHPLLAGALSVPLATADQVKAIARGLRSALPQALAGKSYCVVHVDHARNHDGRGPSPRVIDYMVKAARQTFGTIAVVGARRAVTLDALLGEGPEIVDLQGKLDLLELMSVVASASSFVGIDSFPAHVAQIAGVPSALFFGSVHPLTRIWNESRAWPITARLDCIGCYHSHVEASFPFCMRRDLACTTELTEDSILETLDQMKQDIPFAWTGLRRLLDRQQAKFVRLMTFHPAPPKYYFQKRISEDEVSGLIYEMTDRVVRLYSERHQNKVVGRLQEQNMSLRGELAAKEAQAELFYEHSTSEPKHPRQDVSKILVDNAGSALNIASLIVAGSQCSWRFDGGTVVVTSDGDDPQLFFPLLCVKKNAKLTMILSASADRATRLKLYWRTANEHFSEQRAQSFYIDRNPTSITWKYIRDANENLHLRIDPAELACTITLKGALYGDAEALRSRDDIGLPGARALRTAFSRFRRKIARDQAH
jgi:GT2 family glycosyltransferase